MESPAVYPESPLDQDDVPYPCKGCGDILEEGKAFELAGNRWHIDCFRCSTCGTLLDSDAHLLLLGDGALICSSCTYSCTSCGNKIEDLAILTGEQAFCKRCFRCRNCKREIDNLRYARTSQGIFCMDCHESLMHRRRKRNRAAAASANKRQQHPGVKLDKSLPSLPPEQAEAHARAAVAAAAEDPIADAYADATTEVASRGAAPALDSTKFDNTANVPTPRQTFNEDNLILPSSTYRSSTTTAPREQPESDVGGEFLIPLAFDPSEEKPSHSHSSSLAPPGHHHGVDPTLPESTSPHIAYQEKGRDPNMLEPVRYSPEDGDAASTGPLLSSKAYQPQPAQPPPQHDRSDSVRSAQSDMPSQIRERSSFSSPSPESTRSSTLPTREGSAVESQRSMTTDTTATLPSRPSHELRKLHENSSVDSSRSLPQSSTMQYPPKRGDSLEAKLQQQQQLPRKDYGTSPRPPSVLNPLDDWQGGSNPPPVGQGLSKGSTPKLGDTPRSQRSESYPEPPRHGRQMSHGTVQSDSNRPAAAAPADRPGSPSLLRYSLGGDFSMDEDMQRIMAMDDAQILQNESFLRRMSNSVRHGRSFSDKGSRLSRDSKRPRTPVNGFTPSQDPPTPSAGSPEVRADEAAWLRTELRRERQRTLEREQKIAELERALNATADVKLANTELTEKRSTMVNLDAQKEIAIREISVLTDHLEAEKRGASGPLDLSKITNHVLRDFVESIQKLKDSFSPQIAELVQKRTDTAEELANLNRMKEKSFQEFEQLSSKNAQLADLNNHLVHQIQGLYRANSAEGNSNGSSRANGLGIYPHGKEKPTNSAMEAMKAAGEMTTSISAANMSEEAEPATIVPGPQVVSIRKGQPRKFNWKKGGQNVAKGVTKGLKGAFMSSESGAPQDGMAGLPRSQTQDPSRQGFGFFGNQRKQQAGGKLAQADSVPVLSDAATGLFGTDLEQRMEHEKSIIPAIVTRCIQEVELRGMDMEGIYRKSGAASAIQVIKEGFEKSPQDYDISDPDLDIHAVTSALKQYFRKLPMPLITYDVYEKIIDSGEITSQQTRIDHLRQNLQELPRVHRDVLEFLMFHLRRVVERESENLMTSQNVAVVFAPTIMRPESLAREMTDVQKKNEVLKFLVENCQEVFLGMQGLETPRHNQGSIFTSCLASPCDGYNQHVLQARETSTLEAALPRSTAGVAHFKTRVPSKSEKDKWKGRLSCHPSLSDLSPDKKDEIERKCNRILRSDLPDFLEKHMKLWQSSGFWHSPSLDVSRYPNFTPTNTRGFAIWRYVEAMQTDEATYYLKPRLADIMLYLEYVRELDRQKKKAGHPGQTAKIRATNIICGIGSLPSVVADKTRKSFHEHKLVGERWWWCGCYLGRGLFLLCSPETGRKIQSKSFPLDAFILYALSNCQNLLACCSKFDHLVDELLVGGEFPEQLSKKEVQLWIHEKAGNQENIPTICWKPWSTNAVASKASDFLSARSNCLEHTR